MEKQSEDRIEFIKRFIRPFYMDLMKMNFIRKSPEETNIMFAELRTLSIELNNAQITELLNDNWRESKVGAWMIGISNREDLKIELVNHLKRTDNHYCEHTIFNLFLLDKEESAKEIINYIEKEIKLYVESDELNLEVERISIHWAIAVIKYIDKIYSLKHEESIKTSQLWKSFLNRLQDLKFYETIVNMYDSNYYMEIIEQVLKRIEKNDNTV